MRELLDSELSRVCGGDVEMNGIRYTDAEWYGITQPAQSNTSNPLQWGGELFGLSDAMESDAFMSSWSDYVTDMDNAQFAQQAVGESGGAGTTLDGQWTISFDNSTDPNSDPLNYHLDYSPPASDAGNSFADMHVTNLGTTWQDTEYSQRAHSDVAHFYDYAIAHPNETIDIGQGQSITYGQALQNFSGSISLTIQDNLGLPTGAQANHSGDFSQAQLQFDPGSTNQSEYAGNFGASGIDYVIFHEIGHALNMFNDMGAYSDEAAANTAARSIESGIGLKLMGQDANNPNGVMPGYGYD